MVLNYILVGCPWIESWRFWVENGYDYEIFSILRIAHAWTSIILAGKRGSRCHCTTIFLRKCHSGGIRLSNVRSFIILLSGEGLTSFTINNRTNFFGENKVKWSFPGCLFFRTRAKTWVNPLSPNIHIQILQTDLHTFPSWMSWENLLKDQSIFP